MSHEKTNRNMTTGLSRAGIRQPLSETDIAQLGGMGIETSQAARDGWLRAGFTTWQQVLDNMHVSPAAMKQSAAEIVRSDAQSQPPTVKLGQFETGPTKSTDAGKPKQSKDNAIQLVLPQPGELDVPDDFEPQKSGKWFRFTSKNKVTPSFDKVKLAPVKESLHPDEVAPIAEPPFKTLLTFSNHVVTVKPGQRAGK